MLKNFQKNFHKKTIVSLERNRLYGGISLFGPFFRQKFIAVDCHTNTLYKRGAYNDYLVKNKKIIKVYSDYSFNYKKLNYKKFS